MGVARSLKNLKNHYRPTVQIYNGLFHAYVFGNVFVISGDICWFGTLSPLGLLFLGMGYVGMHIMFCFSFLQWELLHIMMLIAIVICILYCIFAAHSTPSSRCSNAFPN